MNCETELENRSPAEIDLSADFSHSKLSPCEYNAGTSASSAANVNRAESIEKEGLPRGSARGQVPHDASSSEISIRSETLNSINGENLQSTDSDCCTLPVDKSWGKTIRQKSRKRKAKPLSPGYAKDWESNDSWTSEKAQEDCVVVAEEIETKRRKIKSLQQKNRRLKVRHSRLKAAIKEMKANMADRD